MSDNHDEIVQAVRREFACDHKETRVRVKKDKAGRPLFARQCLRCGLQQGSSLPHKQFTEAEIKTFEVWDTGLEGQHNRAFSESMVRRNAEEKERLRNEFLKRHAEYLKSDIWKKLRQKILTRANFICEGCGEARATQVHHMNYERWGGNELLIDLLAVCDSCHGKLHPKNRHIVDVLIESRNLPQNNRGTFAPTNDT